MKIIQPLSIEQPLIQPISLQQQAEVTAETQRFIVLAGELFAKKFNRVPVQFDLIGRTAGMYRVKGTAFKKERVIRYNPFLFAKYWHDNFTATVPHEVAHYVVDLLYGLDTVKPHGAEWRAVMAAFEADDSRTANFEMAGIPQRSQRTFLYSCQCRQHELGIRRHNRIARHKAKYVCRHCKTPLIAGTESLR